MAEQTRIFINVFHYSLQNFITLLQRLKWNQIDLPFLAYLSLYAHWWAYSITMVRRPSISPLSVVRPHSSQIFSKTAVPIKAKFHMELQWDGETKVCSRGLGHMTKMAATPIYGKDLSKIFSRTKGPMTLWLGIWYCGLGPIIICSNDDPGLTVTFFTARSNLVSYAFIWEKLLESHLMEEIYSKLPE